MRQWNRWMLGSNGASLPNSREVVRTTDARELSNTLRNHALLGPK
jgi:hypothetical protein